MILVGSAAWYRHETASHLQAHDVYLARKRTVTPRYVPMPVGSPR